VFIRPTIVRSAEDAQKIAGERYAYVRNAQAQQAGSELTALDELVRDYLRTAPPALPVPPEIPAAEVPKP
jgi:general secretion pathway protein D